jgi:hypothetical protein
LNKEKRDKSVVSSGSRGTSLKNANALIELASQEITNNRSNKVKSNQNFEMLKPLKYDII